MSDYQQECELYAIYGDPARDAYDYEENARYDRYDGFRGERLDDYDDSPQFDDHGRELYWPSNPPRPPLPPYDAATDDCPF